MLTLPFFLCQFQIYLYSQNIINLNKTMKIKILFIALLFFTTFKLVAQSSVYKITGNETTMYLGGTIHILKDADFPLPKEYEEAYLKSSLLILETNIDASAQQELGLLMLDLAQYPEGKSLKTELSKTSFSNLNSAFEKEGLNLEMFNKQKPIMAVMMLTLTKLQKLGYNSEGVDMFFQNKAEKDDISIGSLEKAAFQVKTLAELGDKNPDAFVAYSLKDLDNMEIFFEDMKHAWRTGNGAALVKISDEMYTDYPEIYEKLLVLRNNNWMKKINALMKTSETEFVLVGALHLFGKDGLLNLMKAEGYTIEQL